MIEHGVSALVISPVYDEAAGFDLLAQAGIPVLQVLRRAGRRNSRLQHPISNGAAGLPRCIC